MFDKLSIVLHEEETKYTCGEWCEVPNLLEVSYFDCDNEGWVNKFVLPVFSKQDWEEFKRAGDTAFRMLKGE